MRKIFFNSKSKNKVNWNKGSAELIGVGLAMPVICILIIMVIGIIQVGIMRQALEYTTYMSTRAAVTSSTYNDAVVQATSTAKMTMSGSSFGIDLDDIEVSLVLVGGTSSTSGSGITWEKGALVRCQISIPYRSLISFTDKTMTSAIYAMVETPAKTYY